jgi:hypothetical protein
MAPRKQPTAEDRVQAIRVALSGIAAGADLADVGFELYPLHPKNNTVRSSSSWPPMRSRRRARLAKTRSSSRGIRERYLPEGGAHTKAQHQRSKYALRAAAMIRGGGVGPALLDEIIWWQSDDLWVWALDAVVVYVRAAAERTGIPVTEIWARLARRHGVDLEAPD